MANSVYKSVNISKDQLVFLQKLDEFEIDYFLIEDIQDEIGTKFKNLNEVLENLTTKEFLKRIERGKYIRVNFSDQYVIGNLLAGSSAVAYWSALYLHGLTSRFPNTVFIQTTRRKKSKTIFGVKYKFVSVTNRKYKGFTAIGYGNYKYNVTDINKTLVDCFDLPQYSGGFDELISAFANALINSQLIITYCSAINNIAAIKRMGFIAELFNIKGSKSFVSWAKKQVNSKYNVIDSGGLDEGEFVNDWKIRLNVNREQLMNLRNERY